MALIELLIICLIIYVFLIQTIDVRIYGGGRRVKVNISLTIFAIEFTPLSKKNKKHKWIKKQFAKAKFLARLFGFLTEGASVFISYTDSPTESNLLKTSLYLFFISALRAYAKANAESYTEVRDETPNGTSIIFTFSLARLIISLIKAAYYSLRKNSKGGAQIVRE